MTREWSLRATQTWEGRFHGVLKMINSYFSQCPSGSCCSSEESRSRLKSTDLGYLFFPCHFVLPIGNLKNVSPVGVGGQALAGFLPGTWGKGQEAGAEPEKLQGQWDDDEGVIQKQGRRAML